MKEASRFRLIIAGLAVGVLLVNVKTPPPMGLEDPIAVAIGATLGGAVAHLISGGILGIVLFVIFLAIYNANTKEKKILFDKRGLIISVLSGAIIWSIVLRLLNRF